MLQDLLHDLIPTYLERIVLAIGAAVGWVYGVAFGNHEPRCVVVSDDGERLFNGHLSMRAISANINPMSALGDLSKSSAFCGCTH